MTIYADVVMSVIVGLAFVDGLKAVWSRLVRHRRHVVLRPCGALGCFGCIEERVP